MYRSPLALSFLALAFASTAMASGYRIPEQSLNGTALSNAYLANANKADAAYYNPANMSWLEQGNLAEGGFTYIHLPEINYDDNRTSTFNGESKKENFVIPNIHLVSQDMNNFRIGFSLVAPAGLSKRWEDTFPRTFAEEFSLTVVEGAPSVSYKINDMFSVAAGVRFVYSDATVRNNGTINVGPSPAMPMYVDISREIDGDDFGYGYNFALAARPIDNLKLALTYRSKVDLDLEGDGTLTASQSYPVNRIPPGYYQGDGEVSIPLPAILGFGISYTFDRTTVEFAYDRTFWSDYETLDINYASTLQHPVMYDAFDKPVVKNWDDVDAFRIGFTFEMNSQVTLMAGAGIDGNPVPDSSLSFDLPDSDGVFFSLGGRYAVDEKLSFGAAYLYSSKDDRSVQNKYINGEFSGASSHLLAASVSYNF